MNEEQLKQKAISDLSEAYKAHGGDFDSLSKNIQDLAIAAWIKGYFCANSEWVLAIENSTVITDTKN